VLVCDEPHLDLAERAELLEEAVSEQNFRQSARFFARSAMPIGMTPKPWRPKGPRKSLSEATARRSASSAIGNGQAALDRSQQSGSTQRRPMPSARTAIASSRMNRNLAAGFGPTKLAKGPARIDLLAKPSLGAGTVEAPRQQR
jgi:hypothetical protein